MRKLLDFLYRRRTIAIFIGLEVICIWLIFSFNQRHNANFLNSSNAVAAGVSATSQDVSDYFDLLAINEQLTLENALLQAQLSVLQNQSSGRIDSTEKYSIIGAGVIDNTFRRSTNFLTIEAGTRLGVEPGMGVISGFGVVGQVKSVSRNYATVYSVLHPNLMVSSSLKKSSTKCTVQWDQLTYDEALLKYIPRHINLQVGDTVVTSGFNSVFPQGILVGTVASFDLEDHMTFYEARVKLSTDFTSIPYVFVIKDEFKEEKDSLAVQ